MTTQHQCDPESGDQWQLTTPSFKRTVVLGAVVVVGLALAGLVGYVPGLRMLAVSARIMYPWPPALQLAFLSSAQSCFVIPGYHRGDQAFSPWWSWCVLPIIQPLGCSRRGSGDRPQLRGPDDSRDGDPARDTYRSDVAGNRRCLLLGRARQSHAAASVAASGVGQRLGHGASILGVLTMLVGATVQLAYLYGSPLMYSGAVIPMAATTAIAFIFLGLALTAAAGPASFPLRLVTGNTTSALLCRVFLP